MCLKIPENKGKKNVCGVEKKRYDLKKKCPGNLIYGFFGVDATCYKK